MAEDHSNLVEELRNGGRVSDTQFDKIFPSELRRQGRVHWTGVAIAIEAVQLLVADRPEGEVVKILDVGSNVGKFCLVGALTSRAQFTGVERRRNLADVARKVARELGVQHVRYRACDMAELDWAEFNGIYLFNPFQEHLDADIRWDSEIEFSKTQFDEYIQTVQAKLASCRVGTRVVTYYGFGGAFPWNFERDENHEMDEKLELWIKTMA